MATFHPFPRLPYELRAQIWECTVEPRTVEVELRHRYQQCSFLTSWTPIPAVLQACHESRNHGLYSKVFSEIAIPGKGYQYIWANLEIDIVDIGDSRLRDFTVVAHTFRRLRLERMMKSEPSHRWELEALRNFANVREIHVVCSWGLYEALGALKENYWPCGEENVFFIDPDDDDDEKVFRGPEGLDRIAEMFEAEMLGSIEDNRRVEDQQR